MAEWLKAHAWKACLPQGNVGSNPTLSAIFSAYPHTSLTGQRALALARSVPSFLPGFPWSLARGPELFELLLVAEGVHCLPEAVVEEGLHLTPGDEGLDDLALEHPAVVLDLLDHLGRQDKEAAVDPSAFVFGLLLEGVDVVVFQSEGAEPGDGLDAGEGDELAVFLVKSDAGLDIDVGEAIAVGHAEGIFPFDIFGDTAETASGARVISGVDQGDAPGLGDGVMNGHLVAGDVEGDVGGMQKIVGEKFLDDVALVPEADDEVVDALLGVELEDVQEDGASTNFDHGLGADGGFFTETCAETAGEDDRFHCASLRAKMPG